MTTSLLTASAMVLVASTGYTPTFIHNNPGMYRDAQTMSQRYEGNAYRMTRCNGNPWCTDMMWKTRAELQGTHQYDRDMYSRMTPYVSQWNSYDCLPSNGLYWCDLQSACLRTGTPCRTWYRAGTDSCNTAGGEVWCDSKQSCMQASAVNRTTCPYTPSNPCKNSACR